MSRRKAESLGWAFTVTDDPPFCRAEKRVAGARYLEVGAAVTVKDAMAKCLSAVERVETRWPAAPKLKVREGSLVAMPGKKGGVA